MSYNMCKKLAYIFLCLSNDSIQEKEKTEIDPIKNYYDSNSLFLVHFVNKAKNIDGKGGPGEDSYYDYSKFETETAISKVFGCKEPWDEKNKAILVSYIEDVLEMIK